MASWPIVRWTVPRLSPFFLLGAKIAPILCTRCLHCLFKIYEMAKKAWRIVKCCDTQSHVKVARNMPSSVPFESAQRSGCFDEGREATF